MGNPDEEHRPASVTSDLEVARWKDRLSGAPSETALPFKGPRPGVQAFRGATVSVELGGELAEGVAGLGARHGATRFVTLLAAVRALLTRYTDQPDLCIGTRLAGRTLALRTPVRTEAGFDELLAREAATVIDAQAHGEVTFERIVDALEVGSDASRHPVFQVLFTLGDDARPEGERGRGFARVDLSIGVVERGAGLRVTLEYDASVLEEQVVEQLARHLERVLREVTADPRRPLRELRLLLVEEERRYLRGWNPTAVPPEDPRLVHEVVEGQAARTPGSIAVRFGDTSLTYRDLDRRANQLAHFLIGVGARPDRPIAVCLERSPDIVVAFLAVLKTGSAYLPLDPGHPRDRLASIVEDSGVELIVTTADVPSFVGPETTVDLDRDRAAIGERPVTRPGVTVEPSQLAYVIYTSGSTGKPKGVEIEHRSLRNFLTSMARVPGMTAADVMLAVTTVSFDISGLEIWLPLCVGATTVIASKEEASDGFALIRRLEETGATILQATPATWHLLLGAGWQGSPTVRAFCGGEALPAELAGQLAGRVAALWNLYGPTETTIWSAARPVIAGEAPVVVGGPIDNTSLYVLDQELGLVPPWIAGELFIGGDGLARGYRGRPDLTAERFVPDPLSGVPGARMYRAGDLVRRRPDGDLEFLGRVDHQVKVRGFRIELGEIETVLGQVPSVRACAVVARDHATGGKQLVAYVVPSAGGLDVSEVRTYLRSRLPEYMVPLAFVELTALPLSPNGKLDRKALPAPTEDAYERTDYVAPRSAEEDALARIWSANLGVERVGVHDDFFALGGHSLLAMRMLAQVRGGLGVELTLPMVFDAPTVGGVVELLSADAAVADALARGSRLFLGALDAAAAEPGGEGSGGPEGSGAAANRLDRVIAGLREERLRTQPAGGGEGTRETPPVTRLVGAGPIYPASSEQLQIWMLAQSGSPTPSAELRRLTGPLDRRALATAFDAVVARHEVLRTTLVMRDGELSQVVSPPRPGVLEIVDLSGAPDPLDESTRRIAAELRRPLDLEREPLRVALFALGPEEHRLLFNIHHALIDVLSYQLVYHELTALYRAALERTEPGLPPVAIHYGDYAVWQRQGWLDQQHEVRLEYWKRKLASMARIEMPIALPRPATPDMRSRAVPFTLSKELIEPLRALAGRENATIFMVLLAAFETLLHRYSGAEDLVIGAPFGPRSPELDKVVGCMLNALALRVDLSGGPSFRQVLRRTRSTALEAYSNDVPFYRVIQAMRPGRRGQLDSFCPIVFQCAEIDDGLRLVGVAAEPEVLADAASPLELYFNAWSDDAGGVRGFLEYQIARYDGDVVERMVDHFQRLLVSVVADPDVPIGELEMLSEQELSDLLA